MMRLALRVRILFGLLAVCAAGNASGAEQHALHYRLQVRIQPALHRLEAEAWIQHPPASRFYLYKSLSVGEVIADGKPVPFHTDSSAPRLPYAPMAAAVDVDAKEIQQLQVKYSGEISGVVAGINLIAPGLVELASYAAWYPEYQGTQQFTFSLEANLPQDFVIATNGLKRSEHAYSDRVITDWTSYTPGIDVVLLASPHLHRVAAAGRGYKVEIYYSHLPQDVLKAKTDGLLAAMERMKSLYGPPRVKGILRLVYSPRAGWGYSRLPLIVVSEQRALGVLRKANGQANDFHDNCHEMAHFWWMVADPTTPNDWINEGLAEFTAFRLTEERFGPVYAKAALAGYRRNAGQNRTTAAIAETTGDSPDREINRYDKAALMFVEARRRFGEPALDGLLKAIYARFAGTRQATTASFLQETERQMGKEAAAFFRQRLYSQPTLPAGQRKPAAID